MPNWWDDHFNQAPLQIIDFMGGDGISLSEKVVLDVGCGDGILTWGICSKSNAAKTIGVDLVEVNLEELRNYGKSNGIEDFPEQSRLEFILSTPTQIPLEDNSVDVAVSWSVFEHVHDLDALWGEIRRVLKPNGLIFIQIWPLFWSEHGTHLWPWLDDGFVQYQKTNSEIKEQIRNSISDSQLQDSVTDLYASCNQITVDELQQSMNNAGIYIAKVELLADAFHLPEGNQSVPLSKQGISGIKLLAVSH